MVAIRGLIYNIQRYSLHDGPGIRTTIFFKGCPLACKWCANPESQKTTAEIGYEKIKCIGCGKCVASCAEHAISLETDGIHIDRKKCNLCMACTDSCPTHALFAEGREYTVEEVIEEVLKDEVFYDKSGGGVTLSGGEPLLQHTFVMALLKEFKKMSIHVVVETSGYTNFFKEVLPYIDLLYFDVKHHDCKCHLEMVGQDNILILENLKYAVDQKKEVVARIPVIPEFNDTKESWVEYVKLFQKLEVKQAHLLPFHQLGMEKYHKMGIDYYYEKYPSMKKESLEDMLDYFIDEGIKTQIGG